MKRSEMVEIIKDYLDLLKDDSLNLSKDTQDQAEYILGCCETWGMLPPEIEEQSFKFLPSGEMVYNVNEWEPEDEEK